MDVRCERCKTQYEIDDARISETGVTVQCTTCHHVFVVKKKALVVTVPVKPGPDSQPPTMPAGGTPPAPTMSPPPGLRPLGAPVGTQPPMAAASVGPEPAASLPPASSSPGAREWRVRQASGNVFTLKDLTTLQKWIVERKVSRDDEISATGDTWKRLGDIADLATFFQVVDEAQKAAVLQAQLGMIPGGAPPGGTSGPAATGPRSPGPPAAPPPQPPPPERRGNKLPLILVMLLLLGAGGAAGYYFGVLVPQEEARQAAAARREEERREKERQEQLLAAQAEAQLRADAGSVADASRDGGALGAGAGEGDAGTADAGTEPGTDAGLPDAGGLMDGGMPPDAGTPTVKRPAPVRNFDYWVSQGDRLRERERPEAALDAYAEAAELEPGRAEPYSGRGMALLDMEDARQAEAEFNQALKINPNYGEAIIGLAEAYRSRGKKAEAIRYYERYLQILPNGPEASVARNAIERLKE
ncbi:MAG: zinc-ribbon domain-containing protein [Myxococcaceae bacterium]|nr:zinc-ribbon domain-containing protein [Myxococcaceae bacterium]